MTEKWKLGETLRSVCQGDRHLWNGEWQGKEVLKNKQTCPITSSFPPRSRGNLPVSPSFLCSPPSPEDRGKLSFYCIHNSVFLMFVYRRVFLSETYFGKSSSCNHRGRHQPVLGRSSLSSWNRSQTTSF